MKHLSWTPLLHLPAIAVILSSLSQGCSRRGFQPGAADPERQAVAEHDVGVDALLKGNLRTALAHAEKAVELDESNADAQLLVATVYVAFCTYSPEECRLPEAEKHARRALKAKADFREARNTLGAILVHEKKYDEAIETLRPLTDDILYATPENAWGNLGWAYLEKGDADSAIAALRRAVALQPAFCWGYEKLGLAYEKKGDLHAAAKALAAAVETDRRECKEFADAYESRARVLSRLGDADGARADLEVCSRVGSGTPAGRRCAASLGQSPP